MKTVGELFHSLDRDEVIAAILRLYPEQPGAHPEGYLQAWDIIRAKQAGSSSDMTCELYMHPSFDEPPENTVSVHGRKHGEDDCAYAIEYNPWVEWLTMPIRVLNECGPLSDVEVLAHIFWEMTWAGYDDQEIENQITDIRDRVDEVKEMIAVKDAAPKH